MWFGMLGESTLHSWVMKRDPEVLFLPPPPPSPNVSAGTIFVAPVYLHNILDPERFPFDQLFDATSFHQAVVKEYERIHTSTSAAAGGAATWRQEAPRLVLLLKAQVGGGEVGTHRWDAWTHNCTDIHAGSLTHKWMHSLYDSWPAGPTRTPVKFRARHSHALRSTVFTHADGRDGVLIA